MTILGNGNVGIGTTTPGVKLQVTNGSSGYTWTPNVRTASIIEGNNTNGTALTIVGPSTGNSAIFFATPSSEGIDSIAYDHPSESLRLVVHSLERLRITSAGLVGIGTTTPYASLEVWGPDSGATTTAFRVVNNASTTAFAVYDNGNATYSGSIFQSSDQRLKTDITLLDASSSLVAIEGLTPVSYTRIDQPGSGTNLGFLAQSVQQIFPELVSTTSPTALTPDGTLTLNYVGLIAPMVKAFQALATEVNGFAQSITTAVLNATTINSQQDNTQKLCLSDSSGSTCYTRSQLNALLPVAHCTIQYGTNLSAFPPDATSTSLSSNTDAPPPDAPTASSSPNSTSSPSAATDTGNAASASTTDSTATTASP